MRSKSRPSARAIERPSDVLPTPGGPTKSRIAAARVRLEPPHGEELEDAVLDALEAEVVLVEHLARVREVEVVLGRRAPRQRRDPLQPAADDAVLGGGLRQALQPRELAVDLRADLLGQLDLGELLAQLVDLRLGRVALAELLLDRLELLAQEVLALGACRSRPAPRTGCGVPICTTSSSPARISAIRRRRLATSALLEQRLLLLGLQAQRAGDEVRQRAGVVDVRDGDLQLLGQVRQRLDDLPERLLDVADERGQLGATRSSPCRAAPRPRPRGTAARPTQWSIRTRGAGLDEDAQRPVGRLASSAR